MQRVRGLRIPVALLVVLLALIGTSSALADPQYTVMNAEGGIYWRSEPNWNAAEAISGFGVYNGTTIEVHCYQSGSSVPGSADTMWEQATDVAGSGYGSGWLNEHFINDGQPIDQPSPGVPPCGSPPSEEHSVEHAEEHPGGGDDDATSGGSGTATPTNGSSTVTFNRQATVAWAKAHAKASPGYPAACTWFISQALWAGGLPKTASWTSTGSHGHSWSKRPGTAAAWDVPDFVSYIMGTFPHSTLRKLTFSASTNSVPEAEAGDVIVYDWSGSSSVLAYYYLAHAALIVGFDKNHGPRVAEWGTNGTHPTPYPSRFWTWSKLHNEWLQQEYPKVEAFLLHIDTSQ